MPMMMMMMRSWQALHARSDDRNPCCGYGYAVTTDDVLLETLLLLLYETV